MKNKKLFIIVIAVILVIVGIASYFIYHRLQPQAKIHYHAGFAVFNNNQKIDFSNIKYMYEKPCTLTGKATETDSNNQLEKAHLHDQVGDVVHIEQAGALWKDLFTNIKYPLDYAKTQGYINHIKITNYQNQAIHNNDVLVVFQGSNNISKDLPQEPTVAYIDRMAKKSTSCSD